MFDIYFAGAKNIIADNYLLEHGANRLQSQLIDRVNISEWIERKKPESKLFIDSGAYTAYTKGTKIDVDGYIDYLNSISDKCTIFAQLDTIPGKYKQPKTREDRLKAPELSWKNYLYMRSRLKEPEKLLPIFHQGENFKWLENMLEYVDEKGNHIPYIGVSPAVDVHGLEEFLKISFDIIAKSSNPNVKTHAFGLMRTRILENYPYTSADSTGWKLLAANGLMFSPYGIWWVSDRSTHRPDHIKNQPKQAYEIFVNYVENNGYTLEEIASSDTARYIMNIKYFMNWAKNYKYKGGAKTKRLF